MNNKSGKKQNIEVVARAFIIKRGKILLCRIKGERWFFLPGGHVDFGETVEEALSREIQEELGNSIRIRSFIGVVENAYRENGIDHHEINLIFHTDILRPINRTRENHIEFKFEKLGLIGENDLLPLGINLVLKRWLADRKRFWRSVHETTP